MKFYIEAVNLRFNDDELTKFLASVIDDSDNGKVELHDFEFEALPDPRNGTEAKVRIDGKMVAEYNNIQFEKYSADSNLVIYFTNQDSVILSQPIYDE